MKWICRTGKISLDNYVGVMLQRRDKKDDHMINSPNCHKNIMSALPSPVPPLLLPQYNFNLMRHIETNEEFYGNIAAADHAMFCFEIHGKDKTCWKQ